MESTLKSIEDLYLNPEDKEKRIVLRKYFVDKKISSGSFGRIYRVLDTEENKVKALKIEEIVDDTPTLYREAEMLRELQGIIGIPEFFSIKKKSRKYILAMELLGPSLSSLMGKLKSPFSLKTVLMIGDQLITRIEEIHRRRIIHRDIKPENIVIGLNKNTHVVYLIDFGLGKFFKSEEGVHIPNKEGKSMVGTARFASLSTHKGFEQSRRDDLESLFYTLMLLKTNSLPWKRVPNELQKEKKYSYIQKLKEKYEKNDICLAAPSEFFEFFKYVRGLEFSEDPDYAYLRSLLASVMKRKNYEFDFRYDWSKESTPRIRKEMTANQEQRFSGELLSPVNIIGAKKENLGNKSFEESKQVVGEGVIVRTKTDNIKFNVIPPPGEDNLTPKTPKTPDLIQRKISKNQSREESRSIIYDGYSRLSAEKSREENHELALPAHLQIESKTESEFMFIVPSLKHPSIVSGSSSYPVCEDIGSQGDEYSKNEEKLIDKCYLLFTKTKPKRFKSDIEVKILSVSNLNQKSSFQKGNSTSAFKII